MRSTVRGVRWVTAVILAVCLCVRLGFADGLDDWQNIAAPGSEVDFENGFFQTAEGFWSDDGTTWSQTVQFAMPAHYPLGMASGEGRMVVTGQYGYSSSDGLDWERRFLPGSLYAPFYWRGFFWAREFNLPPNDQEGVRQLWRSRNGALWKHAGTVSSSLRIEAFGRGRVVAFQDGTVLSSEDLVEWVEAVLPPIESAAYVAYGNGRFVVVYSRLVGELVYETYSRTSLDGIEWSQEDVVGGGTRQGIGYGNKQFVALGHSAVVFTSSDGSSWTRRSASARNGAFRAIAFGDGRFVVVGTQAIASGLMPPAVIEPRLVPGLAGRLNDGTAWLTVEGPYGQWLTVEASEDLVNWKPIASDPNDKGEFEVYDEDAKVLPDRFYRVVEGRTELPRDPLDYWRTAPFPEVVSGQPRARFANEAFLVQEFLGRDVVSTNAFDWVKVDAPPAVSWKDRFAGLRDWDKIEFSSDGVNWERGSLPGGLQFGVRALFIWRGDLAGISSENWWLWRSADGINWRPQARWPFLDASFDPYRALYAQGLFIGAASYFPQPRVMQYSEDGVTVLTAVPPETPNFASFGWNSGAIKGMGYGGGVFLCAYVIESGEVRKDLILMSRDGKRWQEAASLDVLSFIYANRMFVATGSNVATSPDGVTWTLRGSGAHMGAGTFGQGRFVLAPQGGVLVSDVMPPAVSVVRIVPELSKRLWDGTMLLTVEAPYGRRVTVEASDNLVDWEVVDWNPCDTGEFEVYDEAAMNRSARFYRAWQEAGE